MADTNIAKKKVSGSGNVPVPETGFKCCSELLLTEQLCFAVYSTGHAFNAAYKRPLKRLGLTYPQFIVMLTLWAHDGRTVKEIGDKLHLDSGTLTPLLKRLEAAGLVTRTRDAADERQVRIRLTPAGLAMHDDARAVPAELSKLMQRSGAKPEDGARLRDGLLQVRDALNESVEALSRE